MWNRAIADMDSCSESHFPQARPPETERGILRADSCTEVVASDDGEYQKRVTPMGTAATATCCAKPVAVR
jgi:hypothetical protein